MARKQKNQDTESTDEFLSDFPSKYRKFLSPEWVAKADAMSDEDLKTALLACDGCVMTTEKDLESDLEIQQLKEELKELEGKYKDIIKEATAKAKYLVKVSKDRGKVE